MECPDGLFTGGFVGGGGGGAAVVHRLYKHNCLICALLFVS